MYLCDHLVAPPSVPGGLSMDEIIWQFLRGELDPATELSGFTGQTSVWAEIVRSTERTSDGWTVNRCERAAAGSPWSIIEHHGLVRWMSSAYSLDQLRNMVTAGQAYGGTEVVVDEPSTKPIPLEWLLSLPVPLAPTPQKQIPWGKIALGAGAVLATLWVIKRATEDPEPAAIRKIAREKEAEGAEVFADVRGYPKPPVMNGRIADVVAVHDDGFIEAIEVENDRSINRPHARGQIEDLAVWASRSTRRDFQIEIVKGGRGGKG